MDASAEVEMVVDGGGMSRPTGSQTSITETHDTDLLVISFLLFNGD